MFIGPDCKSAQCDFYPVAASPGANISKYLDRNKAQQFSRQCLFIVIDLSPPATAWKIGCIIKYPKSKRDQFKSFMINILRIRIRYIIHVSDSYKNILCL